MVRRATDVADRHGAQSECCHHWVIDSPNGPTSKGVCKYCGAERQFMNYCASLFWGDDVSVAGEGGGAQSGGMDHAQD